MKWFKEINTLDDLRKLYRKLVVKHHPDNGGSEETIKENSRRIMSYGN